MQGSDGNFYGTTYTAAARTTGLLWHRVHKSRTNGTLTSLYSFTDGHDGGNPYAGLVQGSDGNFYGTTSIWRHENLGNVFRLTIRPLFQAATITNGAMNLTWSTETGGTYQLQYRLD